MLDTPAGVASALALTARPFGSLEEALTAVFTTMRRLLGMRSLFLSRIDQAAGTIRVIAAANDEGGCGIQVGGDAPLEAAY